MARAVKSLRVEHGYKHRDHRSKRSRDLFHGNFIKGGGRPMRIEYKKRLEELKLGDEDPL